MTKLQNPKFPIPETHNIEPFQLKYIFLSFCFAILKKINTYNLNSSKRSMVLEFWSILRFKFHSPFSPLLLSWLPQRSAGKGYRGCGHLCPHLQAFLSLLWFRCIYRYIYIYNLCVCVYIYIYVFFIMYFLRFFSKVPEIRFMGIFSDFFFHFSLFETFPLKSWNLVHSVGDSSLRLWPRPRKVQRDRGGVKRPLPPRLTFRKPPNPPPSYGLGG